MGRRRPAVAGYFYPSKRDELVESIKWSFLHRLGPGSLPTVSETRRKASSGYVVPHAGYMYSGPVAAHSYYHLANEGPPQTIVLLGTNHTGYGPLVSVYPEGVWETPLGELKVDAELAKLVEKHSEYAVLDEDAHIEEHSVEVQLPFIQFLFDDRPKILPIVIGLHTPQVALDLAKSIHKAVSELGRDVVLLASSDFNHYEPQSITNEKDGEAIDAIVRGDTGGFFDIITRKNVSVCGPGGIMTLIEYHKIVSGGRGSIVLLKHATSGDVTGDYEHVVGYASIRFALP